LPICDFKSLDVQCLVLQLRRTKKRLPAIPHGPRKCKHRTGCGSLTGEFELLLLIAHTPSEFSFFTQSLPVFRMLVRKGH
jgi:hypothetical protein